MINFRLFLSLDLKKESPPTLQLFFKVRLIVDWYNEEQQQVPTEVGLPSTLPELLALLDKQLANHPVLPDAPSTAHIAEFTDKARTHREKIKKIRLAIKSLEAEASAAKRVKQ